MTFASTFDACCDEIHRALTSSFRHDIVADASEEPALGKALLRLRDGMRSNVWKVGAQPLDLERVIQKYDRKTRQIGFHVLNDWDGIGDRVNDDTIPVDVLHYLVDRRGSEPATAATLGILLDYYFMHVLALLSVRVWDEGDADANLNRVDELLRHLQGPHGSGQRFAADAETLILIATSHYELHERGYAVLLERTRTLSAPHQTRMAVGHAASMGCHLRFGFEATYGRDTINMRDDNVADYPWLLFAVATLMQEYVRIREGSAASEERPVVVEALINGLSGDARAFVGAAPRSLAGFEAEAASFRDAFHTYRADLIAEFEAYRPSEQSYSPLNFFFNFSHNVVKGAVIDALLEGRPWSVSLNDLLTSRADEPSELLARETLAKTLMAYARANPHRIRGRLMPVIVYDPPAGRQAFSVALRKMKEQ